MLFLARFGPHADKPDVFKASLEPHLEYLRIHAAAVPLSATMRENEGTPAQGFVWLVKADSREEAERICKEDPFYKNGLRTSFELHHLTKALPDVIATI